MFFDNWAGLARVLVLAPLAYAALVVMLRVSGKRTLTKLNAFDLVITVALGSTLATILLSESVALAEGLLALALLIGMQFAITWASVRSESIQAWIKARPTLVMHRGRFLDDVLRAERVTREELLHVLRSGGVTDPANVASVVLETDGSFTVLEAGAEAPTLRGVEGYPSAEHRLAGLTGVGDLSGACRSAVKIGGVWRDGDYQRC